MQDYYLKFASEQEATSVLYTTPEDGSDTKPNYRNIDVLGILHTTGEDPVALDGWHVNVRVMEDEDAVLLEPFNIAPQYPRRVWA